MGNPRKVPLTSVERDLLRTRGWLSSQPEAFQAAIFSSARSLRLPPGETVYFLDDPPGGLYAVCDGFLDVVTAPQSQEPIFVHVARAGWWVGDAALITGTPRRAVLTARCEVTLAYVPAEDMLEICHDEPEGWRNLATLSVDMFDHALSLIAADRSVSTDDKVRAALRRLVGVGQIYGIGSEGENVSFPINQSDLAELSGLSRNAVGPVLLRLEQAGAISRAYRRITVIDRTRL